MVPVESGPLGSGHCSTVRPAARSSHRLKECSTLSALGSECPRKMDTGPNLSGHPKVTLALSLSLEAAGPVS